MHLMVQTTTNAHVYIVYDLGSNLVQLAIPLVAPRGPLMSLLTHVAPSEVKATFVVPLDGADDSFELFKASFDSSEEQYEASEWDLIFESMHVAFTQQEARSFEQTGFAESTIDAAAKAKINDPNMFAGEHGDE